MQRPLIEPNKKVQYLNPNWFPFYLWAHDMKTKKKKLYINNQMNERKKKFV